MHNHVKMIDNDCTIFSPEDMFIKEKTQMMTSDSDANMLSTILVYEGGYKVQRGDKIDKEALTKYLIELVSEIKENQS